MKSTSFIQDQRHVTKTDKFQPIKPELIESVLANHGFNLASLKTGKARNADRANHQTTVARYRATTEMKIGGHYLDIVAKVPHLYGAVELFLGTYRVICSNGLTVGTKFVSVKIKHLGNPIAEIEQALPILVAQGQAMQDDMQEMKQRVLSRSEMDSLARGIATLRLSGIPNVSQVQWDQLLVARRQDDMLPDLYTTFNRIQENIVRHGFQYITTSQNETGETVIRNGTARKIGETSVRSIEMNAKMWDLATAFLKAA